MKSLIHLLESILTECGDRCRVSTHLDFKRIKDRYEHEGFAFLAITLASFGKSFTKAIDDGFISQNDFKSFEFRSGLPLLLRGFLENVFTPLDGRLLSSPCVDCIRSVRQITLMWAKVNQPASPHRERKAFTHYIERERYVHSLASGAFSPDASGEDERREFSRMFNLLFAENLTVVDQKIYNGEVVPTHGSGSTADSLLGNRKWNQSVWPIRLDEAFPFIRYASHRRGVVCPECRDREVELPTVPGNGHSHSCDVLQGLDSVHVTYVHPDAEMPVKVISVPKTLDKPRIIAMEPTCMMFIQQGIHRLIQDELRNPAKLGYHFVCYDSQLPNQEMARKGSISGAYATVDLTDASDSVSNLLVKLGLKNFPHLLSAVDACRSRRADVQGHGIITLSKFASMGSALCFPFEAMVFCTVVFLGIQKSFNRPMTKKLIKSFVGHVRVYGDDIIVPVEFIHTVLESLEAYGFTVSRHKSFWTGKFRESCGKDYYLGHDVSIVRLRDMIPNERQQAVLLQRFAEFRNNLYKASYFSTCEAIDKHIMKMIPFPIANEGVEGITRISHSPYTTEKWDSELQRPLVKAAVVVARKRRDPLNGYGALLKFFHLREVSQKENPDPGNLLYAGRPVAVDIKRRWVHPDYGVDGTP